ncbi:unnamed protein product [Durusdinium trenchii]|uniref:P4Hc domain-containing protein n=2 Tax=Durusdinium trenchii TaxID=1381693 RepID=A0ABP0LHV6_9DINO
MAPRSRLGALAVLVALALAPCFIANGSGGKGPRAMERGKMPSLRALRLDMPVQEMIEPVTDFAGNGTAFVLNSKLLSNSDPAETQRFDIPGFNPGFVVDGVISTEDCQKVIHISEEIGFRTRWSQVGAVTLFMPEDFSNRIFERLKPFLPKHFGGRPIGIHRRWAVLKYEKGQYLNPHIDGHTPGTVHIPGTGLQKDTGTRSYMTCLFWLSDEVEGGETVFTYPQGGIWVAIPPKTGAALLFFHGQNAVNNPMHYGGDVKSGVKYLVRSDIIYKP